MPKANGDTIHGFLMSYSELIKALKEYEAVAAGAVKEEKSPTVLEAHFEEVCELLDIHAGHMASLRDELGGV